MSDTFYHSVPDYGIFPQQIPAPEADLGEVAARLGAMSTYRRTGRVIWQTGFMDLSGFATSTPLQVRPSVKQIYSGASSLRISPGTGAVVCGLYRYFPPIPETVGLEFTIYPEFSTTGGPVKFPDNTIVA